MIFGLPAILGFLPLLLYIWLMLKGKDMNFSVLLCVILGAVLTGKSLIALGAAFQAALSSFLALIGFVIITGAGLGEVLVHTKVAHNIVYMVINKFKVRTKSQGYLVAMFTCTLLVSVLGTLAGSNAILAPILLPILASLGVTPSVVGIILHGGAATGLFLGPFVPPVLTIIGLTKISYPEYLIQAGIPLAIIVWVGTYYTAVWIQKRTEGKVSYNEEDIAGTKDFELTPEIKRATFAFLGTMAAMLVYGIAMKAGVSYAILVMLFAALITGKAAGMKFVDILATVIKGSSKFYWMFFMFILFDPFLNFVTESGAFTALADYMKPLVDMGGKVMFLMVATLIGVFGISGAGVAQAKVIHDLFLPTVAALSIDMGIWSLVVLVGCQITFFCFPTVDNVGSMGLARSTDLKSILLSGWVITAMAIVYVLIRSLIYVM